MGLPLTDSSAAMLHTSGSGSGSGIPLSTSRSHPGSGAASGAGSPYSSPPYGTLPTPTDSETHSPACGTPFHVPGSTSSSSSPSSPSSGASSIGTGGGVTVGPGAGGGVDWTTYNSYFPMQVSGAMSGVGMGGMSSVGMVGVGVGVGVGENGGMYGGIIAT